MVATVKKELLEMLNFIDLFRPLGSIRTSATLRVGSPYVFFPEKLRIQQHS